MVVNASVFQQVQFGIQADLTTPVAANKLLVSTGIDLRPQGESQVFAPPGSKFDTLVAPNKLWSTGAISGIPTFDELVFILSTIFEGSVSTVGGVSTWTFVSNQRQPDTIKAMTIEQGSNVAGQGDRLTSGMARSFSFVSDRNSGVSQGGEFMGKAFEENITLTPSPTGLALVPILAKDVNVYVDRTSDSDFGSTQMEDAFHVEFACSNKNGQKWALNRANRLSYAAPVELKPTFASRFSAEKNTEGMAFMEDFRTGATAWMRIEAISDILIPTSATPYSSVIDMAVSVERPEGYPDVGGVKAAEYTLRGIFDGVWGNLFTWTIKNGVASLT